MVGPKRGWESTMRTDDPSHTTVAGGQASAPVEAADAIEAVEAVETEGAATGQTAGKATQAEAWLFRGDEAPTRVRLDEAAELAADDANFVWVDLSDYAAGDLEAVARELDLPAAAVRITIAGWQRPRLDIFGDRFFVAATIARGDRASLTVQASELDLFVDRNDLVSAHKRPLPFFDRALARAQQDPDLLEADSAFLLAILLDELISHYEELTEGLENEIEATEERALTDASDAFLTDLLRLKRYVFAIYRLADHHREVFAAFLRPDFPLVAGDEIEPYFRDLNERLGRLLDGLGAAKDSVNGAFDIYVSQVSHRTNGVMRVLTIVSTVLLPATVILGFFGTNFEAPHLNTELAFVVMVAAILVITIAVLLVFRHWGWLGGPQQAPSRTTSNE
jgi:magnesium transporter